MSIEEYIVFYSEDEPLYLQEINRNTWTKQMNPRMCSGHLQGRILSMLSKMICPKNILELGTFTGYSALCLSEGLQEDGFLDTIEIDDELEDLIQENIEKSTYSNKIKLHIGDALSIIPQLDKTYELVFIDADKNHYLDYYEAVLTKVTSGGIILVDNTLWAEKVIKGVHPNDKQTHSIIRFNEVIKSDKRVEKVILPLRDGLTIIRKK